MIEDIENLDLILDNTKADTKFNAELSLRPKLLNEYVGQNLLKEQLRVMLSSASSRKAVLDHILFFGMPGVGKTTLAQILANELGVKIIVTSGQALDKTGDVAAILANIKEGDVLFIDEIHRLRPKVEELLYTAMEDFAIDIVLGKGPTAKLLRLDLPKFSLFGATTRLHSVSNPLKDRFGLVAKISDYELCDIETIVRLNANKLEVSIHDKAVERLAKICRLTPRIANHYLKRARDFAINDNSSIVSLEVVEKLMTSLGLDDLGLNENDRNIISKIYNDFSAGPVGLSTLSASMNEDPDTMNEIFEPYLIRLGLIKRSNRGRLLTTKGIEFVHKYGLIN
jgi:Holliday junction DNA helicase RuvB